MCIELRQLVYENPMSHKIRRKSRDALSYRNAGVNIDAGDRLVERIRPLAEKMKELKMDMEYIEVKGGGHIAVAFDNLPRIFEFFNKHKRSME